MQLNIYEPLLDKKFIEEQLKETKKELKGLKKSDLDLYKSFLEGQLYVYRRLLEALRKQGKMTYLRVN